MAKESIHAKRLRELGFSPIPSEVKKDLLKALERSGLKAKNTSISPIFGVINKKTFATDETGQSWVARKSIDLAPLGFRKLDTGFISVEVVRGKKPN